MPLGGAVEYMEFALQVPGMLERYDAFNIKPAESLNDARNLLSDCECLHGRFQQWQDSLQTSGSGPDGAPYKVLEVEKFPTYAALTANRTLSFGYHFRNQQLGFLYLQYWCSMYFLQDTMAYLREYVQYESSYQESDVQQIDEPYSKCGDLDQDSLAFSLCR